MGKCTVKMYSIKGGFILVIVLILRREVFSVRKEQVISTVLIPVGKLQ